ncbi:alpha-tocopherol transfer protein-like isoform X1 [Rhodnius prolixus]|uniref:alpha-tocopherol transfer protein-like isoform X1 n=1 Tax=Rhodnius prolixus TaxID=13249 RepID=UPI003D18A770
MKVKLVIGFQNKALSFEQKASILEDLGYTAAQLSADVQHIKEWLLQQHHLPPSRLQEDDRFFEIYLTGCKGSLETVKKKIDNYYTIRSTSELYDDRDPMAPEYLSTLEQCEMAVMPQANPSGNRLFLSTITDNNPANFDFLNLCRILVNRTEVYLRLGQFTTQNYMMFNCKGLSPIFTLKMRPSLLRDLIFLLEEVAPLRILKIAFINTPTYVEAAVNHLIKPFLSTKLQQRFYVTSGGHEDLRNYFSADLLPCDYGGLSTNPSLKQFSDKWNQYDQSRRQWYLDELSQKNDESKRLNIDMPKNPYFGVHGSLKKLVID